MADAISEAHVRALFSYDQETGSLYRLSSGRKVGTDDGRGYLRVPIQGRLYKVHRLAWLYVTGEWPDGDVDHINGDRSDNRFANLRVVTHRVNMQNQRRARSDNMRGGTLGVTWHSQARKWRARITVGGRQKHLGHFETPEAAQAAYVAEKRRVHAGCTL